MKPNAHIVTLALAVALAGGYTSQIAVVKAEQNAPASATRKGVIKKIDDSTLVITPSDDKKKEATYVLTASTTRSGQCDVGDAVVISYHYEKGRPVVTTIAGKTGQ